MNSKDTQPDSNPNRKGSPKKVTQDIFEKTDPAIAGNKNDVIETFAKDFAEMRPDKLKYMADMLVELRKIAEDLDEKMVSYLIEMAILELHTVRSLSNFSGEVSKK